MSENDFKSSIQNLDYDNIKFLILQGHINVDSNELVNDNDPLIILLKIYKKPPLHKKIATILKYLINAGFNIHGADSDGNTPIHYAMKNGFLAAIVILLKHKANLANKNKYGFTPIMTALEIKKLPIKELLIPEEFIDNDTLDKNAKDKDLIKLTNKINDFIDFNAFPLIINNQDIFKQFLSRTIQQYYSIEKNTDKIKNDVKNNINYILEKKGIDITNDDSFQIISDMMKKILDEFKPNLKNIDFDFIKNPKKLYKFFIDKIDPIITQSGGAATQNNLFQQFDQQLISNITNYNQMLEYIFKELEILTYKYLLTPDDDNYALQQEYHTPVVLGRPRTQAEQNLHDLFKFFDNIYIQPPAQQNNILQENGFINLHNNENEIAFCRYTAEFTININKNNFIKPTLPNLKNTDGMDIAPPVAINNYIKNPVNENINLQNDNYYSFDINVDALDTISSGLFNVNSESTQIQKNITRNLDSRYLLDNVNSPIPVPTGKGGGPPTRGYTNFKEEAFTLGVIVDPFTNNGVVPNPIAKPTRHFFFFDQEGRITNMPGLNTIGLPDVRNRIKELYTYLNLTNNQDIGRAGLSAKILRETRYSGPQEFNIAEQGLIPGPNNLLSNPIPIPDPSIYIEDYTKLLLPFTVIFGGGINLDIQFQNAAGVVTAGGVHGGVNHPPNWDNVNNNLWNLFITTGPVGGPPYLTNKTNFNKAVAFYYYTALNNPVGAGLTPQEQANRLFAYNKVVEELKKQTKSYGTMEDIGLAYDISYYEFQKGTTQGNRRQQGGAKNRTNQNSKYYIRLKNDKQIDVPDLIDRSRLIRVKSYDEDEDGIDINNNNDINSYSVTEMNPGIEPPEAIVARRPGLGFGPFNDFPAQNFKERDGTPTREFGSLARDDPNKFMDRFNNGIQISDQNYARSNRSLYVQKGIRALNHNVTDSFRPIGTPVIPYIDKIKIFVRTSDVFNFNSNFLSTNNFYNIFSPEYYYQNYLRNIITNIQEFNTGNQAGGSRNTNDFQTQNFNYMERIRFEIERKYDEYINSLKDNTKSIIEILSDINLFQFFIMYYVITSLMILKDELNDLDNEFNITYFEKKYNLLKDTRNSNEKNTLSNLIEQIKNDLGELSNKKNQDFYNIFIIMNTYRSLEYTLQNPKINEEYLVVPGVNRPSRIKLIPSTERDKYKIKDFVNLNKIQFITEDFLNNFYKQTGGAGGAGGAGKVAKNIPKFAKIQAMAKRINLIQNIGNLKVLDQNIKDCIRLFQIDLFYVKDFLEFYEKDINDPNNSIINNIQHRISEEHRQYANNCFTFYKKIGNGGIHEDPYYNFTIYKYPNPPPPPHPILNPIPPIQPILNPIDRRDNNLENVNIDRDLNLNMYNLPPPRAGKGPNAFNKRIINAKTKQAFSKAQTNSTNISQQRAKDAKNRANEVSKKRQDRINEPIRQAKLVTKIQALVRGRQERERLRLSKEAQREEDRGNAEGKLDQIAGTRVVGNPNRRYLANNFNILDGEMYNFANGENQDFIKGMIFIVYIFYKLRLKQDNTNIIGENISKIFNSIKYMSADIRDEWIFNKIKNNYEVIVKEKYIEPIIRYYVNNLLISGKIIDNTFVEGQNLIIKTRRDLLNKMNMYKSLLRSNIRSIISENQTLNPKDIRFLNDIGNYNLLISDVGDTLKSKNEEKFWKKLGFKESMNDGFDLFLEKIIVKEDYDNYDQELVTEQYIYDFRMVKICNDLALWNQITKLNQTLYSNLVLTNQFIKIKLADKEPLDQYFNSPMSNNVTFRFLELMTNNILRYKRSGYEMFYEFINKETKESFSSSMETKYNYPIYGKDFLGCFLMIWDHSIFKLFKKKVQLNTESDYSNLEIKMKYFLPIRKEHYLDNLLEFIKDDCKVPNILNIEVKVTEYDRNYTNKEFERIISDDIKEEIIAEESFLENANATRNLIDQNDIDIQNIANDELKNKINQRAKDDAKITNQLQIEKNFYTNNAKKLIQNNDPKIMIYKEKRLFNKIFNGNNYSFLASIKKYLRNKNEKECINFLYVIYRCQEKIIQNINNIKNGQTINLLFLQYKKEIDELEKVLKNYIEIFPFSLDIQSRRTPFVNNLKRNKPLRLFIDKLTFAVDRYIGNNLYRLIVRLYAKEFFIKYMRINRDDPNINIQESAQTKQLLDSIINELDKNIKPYLTNGKFSKLMIQVVLNIRDEKFLRLKFETTDALFEDLINNKLKNLPISGEIPDILAGFKTSGKGYYKNLYQKFIRNAYSVIINYNRFILNQYKFIRTIKETNDILL